VSVGSLTASYSHPPRYPSFSDQHSPINTLLARSSSNLKTTFTFPTERWNCAYKKFVRKLHMRFELFGLRGAKTRNLKVLCGACVVGRTDVLPPRNVDQAEGKCGNTAVAGNNSHFCKTCCCQPTEPVISLDGSAWFVEIMPF
jgi:hypothetical protein